MFAERTASGYFFDIEWNRAELARYGLSMEEAQASVEKAVGGDNVAVPFSAIGAFWFFTCSATTSASPSGWG